MVRRISPRKLPRWLAAVVAAVLVVVLAPIVAASSSSAAGQVIGGFEIDGNTTHETNTDWNDLSASQVFTAVDNNSSSGQDLSAFQGSSHEFSGGGTWPGWTYGGGNVAGKDDIGRYALYTSSSTVGGATHQFLDLAFDRGAGQGTDQYAFEFNQLQQNLANDPNPRRSQGDIRVILFDQGNGNITLSAGNGGVYKWIDPDQPAGGVAEDTNHNGSWVKQAATGDYFATSNAATTLTSLPSWWTSLNSTGGQIGPDRFVEAGFDLTSFGAVLGCPSEGFTAAQIRSITGTGAGGLMDYVPYVPIDVPSTCSALPIEKRIRNADGSAGPLLGGATFTITPDPRPGHTGGSLAVTDNDTNDSNPADGLILVSPAKPGSYSIVETTAPPGYVRDTTTANVTAPESADAPTSVFLNGLGQVAWNKTDAETSAALAGATFQIKATGGAANAAPWNLGTNPITVTDNAGRDVDPADGAFRVNALPTGTYQLTETAAPIGYALDPTTATFTISSTTVVNPSHATFADPHVLSRLTVHKTDAGTNGNLAGAVFTLYRDDNGTAGLQQGSDSVAGTCITDATGTCSVPAAGSAPSLDWGFTYYWVEVTAPPGHNLPNNPVSAGITITAANAGTGFPQSGFADPVSAITTSATATSLLPGASISDTATLSGVPSNAGGSVEFTAYGPVTTVPPVATCTPGNLAFTSAAVPVSGPGNYGPAGFSPTRAGTYYWVASYSGDATHQVQPVVGTCGDLGETSAVLTARPGISTDSSGTASLPGASISDVAKVTPVTSDATGTVSFTVYGPGDSTCTGTAAATYPGVAITVLPDGLGGFVASASSPTFQPTQAGTYRWIAAYSGDANNTAVSGSCGDPLETSVVAKASPAIGTFATASVALPSGTVNDVATVSGLTSDATGTVTFALYGPQDTACAGPTMFAETDPLGAVTGGSAAVTSSSFTPLAAGDYRWIATYSGDANNSAIAGTCGEPTEVSVVTKAAPAIATSATATASLPAGSVDDTANLTGLTVDATGTITFTAYGAGDLTCTGGAVFTSTVALINGSDGTGSAVSNSFVPIEAGIYRWVANYSGDANNNPVSGTCGADGETTVIGQAATTIGTTATSGNLPDAGSIQDSATVTGLTADATGTITFDLYGNNTCTGDPIFTSTVPMLVASSDGTATSDSFAAAQAGDYFWVASYSGDVNNSASAGTCGALGETSRVAKAAPTISTSATGSATLPNGAISDNAVVAGVTSTTTGTVTFNAYGPNDATCVGTAAFTSTVEVSVIGETANADSGLFTPTQAGTYRWVASYSGDANNDPVTGACGAAGETSVVNQTAPGISTAATESATLPAGTIGDTATVTGLTADATGTVTFTLFGPGADCSGDSVFSNTAALVMQGGGLGTATGSTFQPTLAGVYHWIAAYSGDVNNGSVTGECLAVNETSTIAQAVPSISTSASTSTVIADEGTVTDVATVTGATTNATGTITFALYGADDQTCDSEPVFTSTVAITNNGGVLTATSDPYTPTVAGTYHWVASYSGDANNAVVAGVCGDTGETTAVRQGPSPTLDKTADPASGSVVANGSTITYTVTASNIGDVAIDNGVVTDVLPAHVTLVPGSISNGGVLSAGVITWTLDFGATGSTEPPAQYVLTYKVTVDNDTPPGTTLTNEAKFFTLTATTTHSTPPGPLTITKTNAPSGTVAPGDTITYTLQVKSPDTSAVNQQDVVVTDYIPGHDPDRTSSASTTYVADSAACTGTIYPSGGTCDVTLTKDGSGTVTGITWALGTMAPGQVTNVVFKVTVDALPTGIATATIDNAGAVAALNEPQTPSNVVHNTVQAAAVLGEKQEAVPPSEPLPHTGFDGARQLQLGLLTLVAGAVALAATRRRRRDST